MTAYTVQTQTRTTLGQLCVALVAIYFSPVLSYLQTTSLKLVCVAEQNNWHLCVRESLQFRYGNVLVCSANGSVWTVGFVRIPLQNEEICDRVQTNAVKLVDILKQNNRPCSLSESHLSMVVTYEFVTHMFWLLQTVSTVFSCANIIAKGFSNEQLAF
jgi:hypothetical protein